MEVRFVSTPPQEAAWRDDAFGDAYFNAWCAQFDDECDAVDEDDHLLPPDLDSSEAQGMFEELVDIEGTVRAARATAVAQDAAFHHLLTRAGADPVPWVGPDPTEDPLWTPPPGYTVASWRSRRRSLAVRSAAADIAVRVSLTDNQVRNRAHRASVLSARCPNLWQQCLAGLVSEQNVATAVDLASSLPDDAPGSWAEFDDTVTAFASTTAPGRFRTRARAARERAHRESLHERHRRAADARRVYLDPLLDGMAQLVAIVPAHKAQATDALLDDLAGHLSRLDGESRTHAQLRADAFCDLLLTGTIGACGCAGASAPDAPNQSDGCAIDGDAAKARAAGIVPTVRITIPALTLLGHSDEPATLDGYGPIDLDTARQLAGGAASWIRVLTHPVSGTVMDVDRRAYRVPADLRRFLEISHPTCVFPGCERPSHTCDIDHRHRWTDGGATAADNLAPLSDPHHTLKDETLWELHRDPQTGQLRWTSPSGYVIDADPPPF